MRILALVAALTLAATACSGGEDPLTVYSGRSEELVGPIIERFEQDTGIEVTVRYAGSTELAATILEEGDNSPADVFFAQDPASLGRVALEGLFSELPQQVLELVPSGFSDDEGRWVGTSGRARVLVVSNDAEAVPPPAVDGLTDETWNGRLGIAPGNGSFLAFVAAMILIDGEEATAAWLDAIADNDPVRFESNSPIVAAADEGSIDGGLVNHYYLLRLLAEQGEVSAENWFFSGGPGALVMPAGAGILEGSDQADDAAAFIEYLLSEDSQNYFATETFEYPLLAGVPEPEGLPGLAEINAPIIRLSALATALDKATELVSEAGLL